jgi:DNA-binding MarR family transcriptional regulator
MSSDQSGRLGDDDYARLLAFRDGLRRFLRWSEEQAKAVGLTGAQHQLLLAVRGHPGEPTIGDLAEHLLCRHHSAVGLVDRCERAGLVERRPDPDDRRVVHLRLTAKGSRTLDALSALHVAELSQVPSWLPTAGLDPAVK